MTFRGSFSRCEWKSVPKRVLVVKERQFYNVQRSYVEIFKIDSWWYQKVWSKLKTFEYIASPFRVHICCLCYRGESFLLSVFQFLAECNCDLSSCELFFFLSPKKDIRCSRTRTKTHQWFWRRFLDSVVFPLVWKPMITSFMSYLFHDSMTKTGEVCNFSFLVQYKHKIGVFHTVAAVTTE